MRANRLNPQYARVITTDVADHPLSVHCRAQEEAGAIPHWSLELSPPTGLWIEMPASASTLYQDF